MVMTAPFSGAAPSRTVPARETATGCAGGLGSARGATLGAHATAPSAIVMRHLILRAWTGHSGEGEVVTCLVCCRLTDRASAAPTCRPTHNPTFLGPEATVSCMRLLGGEPAKGATLALGAHHRSAGAATQSIGSARPCLAWNLRFDL
jgi:hypothetical protein